MPITGPTPKACFAQFRTHVAQLVGQLVPTSCPMLLAIPPARPDSAVLSFKNQHHDTVPLDTNLGTVHLYLGQTLQAQKVDSGYRLRTVAYYYKLFSETGTPASQAEPMFRWEYAVQQGPIAGPCRNHFQIGRVDGRALTPPLGAGKIDLNRVHLPTGWVLIEEVFRFLIHELEMKPPCGNEWPDVLHTSEKMFREKFHAVIRHSPRCDLVGL